MNTMHWTEWFIRLAEWRLLYLLRSWDNAQVVCGLACAAVLGLGCAHAPRQGKCAKRQPRGIGSVLRGARPAACALGQRPTVDF